LAGSAILGLHNHIRNIVEPTSMMNNVDVVHSPVNQFSRSLKPTMRAAEPNAAADSLAEDCSYLTRPHSRDGALHWFSRARIKYLYVNISHGLESAHNGDGHNFPALRSSVRLSIYRHFC
jgi:tRNA isopentenyl-2-thiomethyl-A-37 hydroxylase MiaE